MNQFKFLDDSQHLLVNNKKLEKKRFDSEELRLDLIGWFFLLGKGRLETKVDETTWQ